ncbi:MAG TPA: hypothetical protein PKD19_02610 [Candidatus Saccharibacteria bacterium]|nr:hypothetical protein [Candidatus Saccharibacteria bacterium]HMR38527.1 hypothetical protein [Candidatus Saccharibacteria bacterium]
MSSSKQTTSVRKRQKIQQSNKTMFVMVAIASATVGLCLVISWLIFQQLLFSGKVVSEKSKTLDSLKVSNQNIQVLSENIRVLETNKGLNAVKASPHNKALQSILDALPADANGLAAGASIQDVLAKGISGLSIESLSVTGDSTESETTSSEEGSSSSLPIRLTVIATRADALQELLERFEKSIRVIGVDNLSIERSDNRYTMMIEAHAYYEPAKIVELQKKVVKP